MGLKQVSSAQGTVGGRYRLQRLLGRGAHGTVYEASHVHLGRRYALKVLGAPDEQRRDAKRFEREALVLASLNHQHVVGVVDAGEDPVRGQYLVLELVEGQTLSEELSRLRAAGLEAALEVLQQLAEGLQHAHERGVIHRDLKPDNIKLQWRSERHPFVKILDFGIARLIDPGPDAITRSGTALGTPAYMAPEQARGERTLDGRADVFALGVIGYELLTGVRPFDGASYNETLFRVVTHPHQKLCVLRPDLPSSVERVFDRVLHKEPAQRYSSASEFVLELVSALGISNATTAAHVSALPLASGAANAPQKATARPAPAPSAPDEKAVPRGPRVALSAALLVAIAGLALILSRTAPPGQATATAQSGVAGSESSTVSVVADVQYATYAAMPTEGNSVNPPAASNAIASEATSGRSARDLELTHTRPGTTEVGAEASSSSTEPVSGTDPSTQLSPAKRGYILDSPY